MLAGRLASETNGARNALVAMASAIVNLRFWPARISRSPSQAGDTHWEVTCELSD